MADEIQLGEFLIGRARQSDAPQMLDLILRAFAEYRGVLVPESSALGETPDSVQKALAAGEELAARNGGRMIGCVVLEPRGAAGLFLDGWPSIRPVGRAASQPASFWRPRPGRAPAVAFKWSSMSESPCRTISGSFDGWAIKKPPKAPIQDFLSRPI